MLRARFARPTLKVPANVPSHVLRMGRITWQEVLHSAGRVQNQLDRLGAARNLTPGAVTLSMVIDKKGCRLESVEADAGLRSVSREVGDIVSKASFPPSATPMQVELQIVFEDASGAGAWDPDDPFADAPARGGPAFGDPF